jgi:hypothetical protein
MTKSPTLSEFKETVRDAFGYLRREFAFREVEPQAKLLEANPFILWFANATTLVQVEGTNWGFAAQVILGPGDAGDRWHDTVPLWAVIRDRRPDLYEEATTSAGQLGDIRVSAKALREAASDVLIGNFGVFASARAIVEAQGAQQRIRQHEEMRELSRRAAVAAAADAFRARDFPRVVELLMPHADLLIPAERARLDYARVRAGRDVGRFALVMLTTNWPSPQETRAELRLWANPPSRHTRLSKYGHYQGARPIGGVVVYPDGKPTMEQRINGRHPTILRLSCSIAPSTWGARTRRTPCTPPSASSASRTRASGDASTVRMASPSASIRR